MHRRVPEAGVPTFLSICFQCYLLGVGMVNFKGGGPSGCVALRPTDQPVCWVEKRGDIWPRSKVFFFFVCVYLCL